MEEEKEQHSLSRSIDSLPFPIECHTQQGFDENHRSENQDRHYYCYDSKRKLAWLGVFDGHSGSTTAEYVCSNIVANIRSFLPGPPTSREMLLQAISKGISLTESRLVDLNDPSGTCLLLVCLYQDHLIVANVGDSRAVLGRLRSEEETDDLNSNPSSNSNSPRLNSSVGLESHQLSNEHNATNQEEAKQARIRFLRNQKSYSNDSPLDTLSEDELINQVKKVLDGDDIIENGRLFSCEFTRSLGDFGVKRHCFGVVSPEPEITAHQLTSRDLFIILASDGVFLKVDNQTAVEMVFACLRDPSSSSYSPAETLVRKAVDNGSGDDQTVLVLDLLNYRSSILNKPTNTSSPLVPSSSSPTTSSPSRNQNSPRNGSPGKVKREEERMASEMFRGLFVSWYERSLADANSNHNSPKRNSSDKALFGRFEANASEAQVNASEAHRIKSKFVSRNAPAYSGLSLFERHAANHQKLVSAVTLSRKMSESAGVTR